jgi:hypothetical protein
MTSSTAAQPLPRISKQRHTRFLTILDADTDAVDHAQTAVSVWYEQLDPRSSWNKAQLISNFVTSTILQSHIQISCDSLALFPAKEDQTLYREISYMSLISIVRASPTFCVCVNSDSCGEI